LATVVSNITNDANNASLLFKLNMLQHQFSNQESPEALLQCQMVTWAKIKIGFHHTMKQVYRDNYTFEKAESLRQQALDGNFEWLPEVRYVDADSLGGANGAYDADSATLLLNADLAGSALAVPTLVEEAGHHLDNVLNISDARGDDRELSINTATLEC